MLKWSTLLIWILAIQAGLIHAQGKVDFKDQVITITNPDIRKNEIRAGVQGIQFTCYAVFKYGDDQIKGADESDYLRQYYFFLEIKKGENADRVFYPIHNPDQENKETTFDEYYKVRVTDNGRYYVRIFIPYHQFQLITGFHKINVSLSACDENAKYFWRNLYQTDITIEQPVTYMARLTLSNARLIDKKYDMPANKIPFFGLFVGGKKSKAGQGLPDASWRVKIGNDIIYESEVNKNSLDLISGSATFKISKGDPVKLIVFDEDYFKSDEDLGVVNYYSTNDVGRDEKKNYAFKDVETSDIIFERTVIPSISSIVVDYHVKKFEGITGIELEVLYVMAGLQPNDAIMLRPVFRDKNGKTTIPEYIKLSDVNFEKSSSTGNLVTKRNGPDKQIFFIPHYACNPDLYPGIEFVMDNYNGVVQSQFSRNKLEEFGIISDDVKVRTETPEENSYNGYWGLKFPIIWDIPETYYDDLKYTDIKHSIKIMLNDTLDITGHTQIISFFGDTSLGNIELRKIRQDKILHIPYSLLNLHSTNQYVKIYTYSQCLRNQTIINKDTITLHIENPNLTLLAPFDLKFRIKDKKLEKGYAKIYRGKTLLKELSLAEIPKNKKYSFKINLGETPFHINDELRIEVVGIDYFKIEKSLYKTVVEPLQINYNIIPERRKMPKNLKGFRIKKSSSK